MVVLRLTASALLLLTLFGCGGKATSAEEKTVRFVSEGTCVSTFPVAVNSGDYGFLQGIGRRHVVAMAYSTAAEPGKVRFTEDEGCSFLAEEQGDVLSANDIDCDALPKNSPLSVGGATSSKVLSFHLHAKALTYRYDGVNFLARGDSTISYGPAKNHYVCEGRLNGGMLSEGVFALRYEGETNYSVQQPPEVEEAALPGCTNLVGWGTCGGSLLVHFGSSRNELVVYEEGVGCTVTATSQDGVVFRADGAECVLNDIGIRLLGVQSRKFESYSIDFSTRTWTYSSTLMQMRSSGVAIPYCLNASAQLIGDLPK